MSISKKHKIAFFEVKDYERAAISKELKAHTIYFSPYPLSPENISDVKDYDILCPFIYSKVTKEVIDSIPSLRYISTQSTGFDHIDVKYCKKKGIIVSNVPAYGENTVAEHTFALMLSISRNIHKSYLRTMAGDFSIEGLKGFDLKGKTLGVIGTGHIGQHVIRIAKGFEMDVVAYDKFPDPLLSKKLNFTYTTFDRLLKSSDIITLHIPYTKENYHLISKANLSKMKKGSLLINTSRGELIDTNALLSSLTKGDLCGAGLDVIEGERLLEEKQLIHQPTNTAMKDIVQDLKLIRSENVVFTPHIAFFSNEALERILETTISNINSFIKNRPQNIIRGA